MRKFMRATFAGVLLALMSPISLAVDYGRTVGSFGVSPSGAATYTIPIWTPPGPNGLTPSISVDYNSQGGNGLAGVGWNLSATSSIERCNRTRAQDTNPAPVDLSANDRYCIGGNRLRLDSGTYGAAGSVYYTEIADFSRIKCLTGIDGALYFSVEAKSGLKYEYGRTADSRVALGGTVLRWMLNKVYDRNGDGAGSGNNYIISYTNTNAVGFVVPDTISWTPTNLGLTTYRYQAKFNYDPTPRTEKDSYTGNVAGFDVSNRNRLHDIQIKSAGTVIRKYRFSFDTSSVTFLSRLTSAKECADDAGDIGGNCLLPINFSYQGGQSGVTVGAGAPPAGSGNIFPGRYDLNGDGKDDLLYLSSGTCYAAFGANNGFSSPVSTGKTSCGSFVDRFMPSGRDAMMFLGSPVQVVYWNDATSAFVTANMGFNQASVPSLLTADYDGDGLADLAYPTSNTIVTRRNTSTGGGAPSFSSTTLSSASLAGIHPNATWGGIWPQFLSGVQRADFNGDGTQDITGVYAVPTGMGATTYNVRLFGYANGFALAQSVLTTQSYTPALNFNGDGCTDVLIGSFIQVSPCNAVAASTVAVPATPVELMDWDGDGKTDILANGGGTFVVYLSTGTGFLAPFSTSISATGSFYSADLDGDHHDDLIKFDGVSPIGYWTHTAGGYVPSGSATNIPDLLSNVVDGFGVSYSPTYLSTGWGGNYDKGFASFYPIREAEPRIVVAQVTASNGIGGTYNKTYYYVGDRVNAERLESVGFQRVDETDSRNSLISRTYYEQNYPKSGMVSQRELMQPNGFTTISHSVMTYAYSILASGTNNQRFFVYPQLAASTQYEVGGIWNGALLRTVNVTNSFDNFGTLVDQTIATAEPASGANGVNAGGNWAQRIFLPSADLLNDTGTWCLGRPRQIQQTNSSNLLYGTSITRTTGITWDAGLCRPTQTMAEPTSGTLRVTTDIGYDVFGNVTSTTVTGVGVADTRGASAVYADTINTTGQFPLKVTNALGQFATTAWDYNLGVPLSATDPNGLVTSWQYDPYGRRSRENHPDGTYTTWTIGNCAGCSAGLKTDVDEIWWRPDGNFIHREMRYLDQFDRSGVDYSLGAGGTFYNVVSRAFDALGNLSSEYFPYTTLGSPVGYQSFAYDLLNRPVTMTRPVSDAGSTPTQATTISYEGLTTRVTDPQGKWSSKTVQASGLLGRSTDNDSYYQQFDYDAFGNVKRVQDPNNTLQSSLYNLRGMLTQRTDMDMGTWNFTPNAFGETVSQTDAKNQTTTFVFDVLGRLTSRNEAEGLSTFKYGTSSGAKNIGRLEFMSGPGYLESFSYDSIGRPSSTTVAADASYTIDYSYNSAGALDTVTYPTSTSSYRLKLQYEYAYGSLVRVKDFNSPTTVYWAANAFNSLSQVTQETLGNGLVSGRAYDLVTGRLKTIQTGVGVSTSVQNLAYTWDLVGNLASRKDVNQANLTETFTYDNLYRLRTSQRNGAPNQDLNYDALGNIMSKLDVGGYNYHATKKHQLISITGANNWSFGYDNNGNMTSGRGSSTDWTSYNYPSCVRTGAACTGTTSDYSQFSYTPDRQYWKQVSNYTGTGGGTATTIYVGGLLEKVTTTAGTDYRHMIRAGNSTIIVSRPTSGTNSVSYVTSDHLGSSSAVTNSSGGMLANLSFDAFGKRRGSNWSGPPSAGDWAAIAATTRRGYTEHSMLDNLNLAHMNGRVYDQVLGRFVSADPYITEPGNTQNFNRYAYVYNNPLSGIDPSGFAECDSDVRCGPRIPNLPWAPTPSFCLWPWQIACYSSEQPAPEDGGPADDGTPVPLTESTTSWSGIAVAEFLSPNLTAYILEEADVPRTLSDDVSGGAIEALNTYVRIVQLEPTTAFLYKILGVHEVPITPAQRRGAAAIEVLTAVVPVGEEAALGTRLSRFLPRVLCCFAAGTLVSTEDGLRPIEEIQVGDRVWSRDPATGEIALKPVENLIRLHDRVIWLVTFDVDESDGSRRQATFEVTDDHSWASADGQWIWTKDLKPGMQVRRANGAPARVALVSKTDRTMPTYNLEVADFHTYFVGESKLWVHNGLCDVLSKIAAAKGAANRAASRTKGIPDSQLGPSGLPKRHTVEHSSRKEAREAAQREVPPGGRVRSDASPADRRQGPHYQAEDAAGDNVRPVVHHEYPE